MGGLCAYRRPLRTVVGESLGTPEVDGRWFHGPIHWSRFFLRSCSRAVSPRRGDPASVRHWWAPGAAIMSRVTGYSAFDASAPPDRVRAGEAARLRMAAALTWLALTPGFAFVRQRSNFILGWRAAAAAGTAVGEGESAGAVGTAGVSPLGAWMMLPALTSPSTQTVLPMNDSLYGAAHLELDRQGPVVVSLPRDDDGRYYSVTVMDAHFTNVAHLGPRWTGRDAVDVLLVPPGWSGQAPAGIRVIECPTASVCLLNRALVDYAPGDLDRVRAWRGGIGLRRLDGGEDDPQVDDLVHPDAATLEDPWRFLRIGREHLRRNPLPPPARWALELATVEELLDAATDPTLAAAVERGIADARAMVDATLTTWPRRNGWMLSRPEMGLPNPHVLHTAALELFQVGFNDIAEAAYFFGDTDRDGVRLDGSGGAAYQLTFPGDKLPPVHDDGFWSLTMYGDDNLLVDNPIDRYSTRATRPGFTTGEDGSATVVLSRELPPGVPEGNWLPAPDGPFRLGVRLYYPDQDVVEGGWVPPAPEPLP